MAKPKTYEFPALRVPGTDPLVIDPATPAEEWALRKLLWKGDYPENVMQDIFKDPGPYYRKLAQNFLKNNPYKKPIEIDKPFVRDPKASFIMPEEEYQIEIFDPTKDTKDWAQEDLSKGWRSIQKEEEVPYVSPHSIEAIPDEEEEWQADVKERAKIEEAAALREHHIKQQQEWWKNWSKEKLKAGQEEADFQFAKGNIPIEQYVNFHTAAQKGLNKKGGKGEELTNKDLLILAGYAMKDPEMKQIKIVLEDDYSNLDKLIAPVLRDPMTEESVQEWKQIQKAKGKDSSNIAYMKKRKEQDDILMVHKIGREGKSFEDITWAQGVVNRLRSEDKITSKQFRSLNNPLLARRRGLENELAISEAGGELAYKKKQFKTKAKKFTFDARMKQYEEIQKMEALWQRVVTVWKGRYQREGNDSDKATRMAIKKANSVFKVPTMNWRREPKIGKSLIRGDKGQFIWDSDIYEYREATSLERLSNAFKRQPIATSVPEYTNKALEKIKARKRAMSIDEAAKVVFATAHPGAYESMLPVSESGLVYESPVQATMRATLGPVESAVIASMRQLGSPYVSKDFPVSDSGKWIDDFSASLSKGKFLPEYFEATLGDSIGKEKAWWMGLGSSMILPVTGIGLVPKAMRPAMYGTGAAIRAAGALTKSEKALVLGKEIQNAASLFNWVGEGGRIRRLTHAMKNVESKQDIKALVKEVKAEHSKDFSWKEWFRLFNDKNSNNKVSQMIVDRMAERQAGVAVAKGLIDGKRLDEKSLNSLLHNKDIAVLWLKSGKDLDQFKKSIDSIWEKMEKAARSDAIARRSFNEASHVKTLIKNIDKIKKTQEVAPWLEGSTPLSKEFNDALFTRMIDGANLSDLEMEKFFKKIADLPKEERTGQKMAEMLRDVRKFDVEAGKPRIEGPSLEVKKKKAVSKDDFDHPVRGMEKPDAPPTKERLPSASLAPWDASINQMEGALKDSLRKSIGEKVLDFLPYNDVHSLNGGVFQRSGRLNDKKSQAAFKREYDRLLGPGKYHPKAQLKDVAEMVDLPLNERLRFIESKRKGKMELVSYQLKNNTEIFNVMTKELGRSNIMQSGYYMDLLKKIKDNEPLNQFDFFNVKNTIARALNKKHFDAFELSELGRQAERAMTEMAGFFPTATTKGRSKTPSTMTFTPVDLVRSIRTLVWPKPFPVTDRYQKGDLKINQMLKKVDDASTNIEDDYVKDIRMTMNRLKKEKIRSDEPLAVKALDEVATRVWNTERVDVDKRLDAFVQRHYGGSYKEMAESGGISTTEGRDLYQNNIKKHVDADVERGVDEAEAYKKWTREYNAFLNKRDAWESMVNQYYGIELKSLVKESPDKNELLNTFMKLYDEAKEGRVAGTVAFDPFAGNMLDPSLTNLQTIINRIDRTNRIKEEGLVSPAQAWKGKLPGFEAKRATSAALHPWALGTLQSGMVRREIAEFAMTNPTKVVSGVLNPLAGSTMLDPKPLHEYYKGLFEDLMKKGIGGVSSTDLEKRMSGPMARKIRNLLKGPAGEDVTDLTRTEQAAVSYPFGDVKAAKAAAEEADVALSDLYAEAMTKAHLSALQKVSYEDRINILSKAGQKKSRMQDMYADLSELIPIFQFNMREVLQPLNRTSKNIFQTLVKSMDMDDAAKKALITHYNKKVQPSMEATMIGEGVVKSPLQSGAQYTIMGDMERAWKEIQRAGGSAVGDDLPDLLGEAARSYKRLKGTDFFVTYGRELEDAMRNLSDLASKKKLDFMADRLRNDSNGRLVLNTIGEFLEAARASTVSGHLGGWGPFPGGRYLGVNVLTAPVIATAAAGKHGLGTINPKMHYVSLGLNGMPVDKVVFKTPQGIPYTAGELRYIQGMANKGFSQESLHFATNNAKKIMRDLSLTLKGLPKGRFRSFVEKNLLPTNMNMYSKLAMDTDRHFRNTVRFQALKNGLTVDAANSVAKKSMLDYGAPSALTSKWMSRYTLYWRFQYMMWVETMNNLSRAIASDKPSIAINAVKANNALMRDAETWLYSDDSIKSRMFPIFKKSYRDKEKKELGAITAGPSMPTVEAFETSTNLAYGAFALYLGDEPDLLKTFRGFLTEGQYLPAIDLIKDTLSGKQAGAKLRDDYIPLWKANGTFEQMKERYDLVVRDAEKQKWMDPAWGDDWVQFEYGSDEGRNKHVIDTFIGTIAGYDRIRKDYAKAYMAGAEDTLEARYGRYGDPDPLLYLIGAETSFPILEPGEKGRRELQRAIRALKELEQQGSKKGAKE